jgi:hypothetical protein
MVDHVASIYFTRAGEIRSALAEAERDAYESALTEVAAPLEPLPPLPSRHAAPPAN